MPSQYPYRETVRNKYLGLSKVIRAMTAQELDWLVEAQLAKWRDLPQKPCASQNGLSRYFLN